MNVSNMNNTTALPPPDLTEFFINQKIRLTLMILSVVAGLVGNALVVIIILTKKTRRINDDNFLLNLACADFLNIAFDTGRFVVHLSYVGPIMKTLMWCKIFWAILSVPFCAGIFTITAISLHRCWVIVNPFQPKIRLLWINLCILSTWGLAIVLFIPITTSSVNMGYGCVFPEWSTEDQRAYSIALAIIQYPLPLLVIMIAYFIIGFEIRNQRVSDHHRNAEERITNSLRHSENENHAIMTKTVGAIVLLFAILLLPLQVAKIAFYQGILKTWVFALWDYGDVFATMHSAINPYLYTIRTPYYRKHIISWFRRQPETNNVLSSTGEVIEFNEVDASKNTAGEGPKELGADSNGFDAKF